MMGTPLVTVVCLCYNHEKFVREAVESVLNQTYPLIQVIMIDDSSTDGSVEVMRQIKGDHPEIELILLEQNVGSCRAFNQGLKLAKGEFIIDLAADDLLMPDRIQKGVDLLTSFGDEYGITHSDANYIDEQGRLLWVHSERYPHNTIPQGNIYSEVIQRYFICPPTLMMRASMLREIGGFDESLLYEDFDLLVRSSRNYKFCYIDEVLVCKRVVKNSLSSRQNQLFSSHSTSTYKICNKVLELNRTESEKLALSKRIRYEIRNNMRLFNFRLVLKYLFLLSRNRAMSYSQ